MISATRRTIIASSVLAAAALAVPAIASTAPTPAADEAQLVAAEPSLFVPIEHFRADDSRTTEVGGLGKLTVGGNESDFVDFARREGDSFDTRRIPKEATAVSFNLTVTQTRGRGFLHVDSPIGESTSGSSTVNWTGDGQTVANSGVTIVGTTDAEVVLFAAVRIGGEPGASAHVIADVTGYYIPG